MHMLIALYGRNQPKLQRSGVQAKPEKPSITKQASKADGQYLSGLELNRPIPIAKLHLEIMRSQLYVKLQMRVRAAGNAEISCLRKFLSKLVIPSRRRLKTNTSERFVQPGTSQ
ncbi:unnamed protein product, partial [Ilex paraguariensis]